MASLRETISQEYDRITEGIAWIVIYKQSRAWKSNYFYPEGGSYDDGYILSKEDQEKLREITEIDDHAICINGYYMGFGEELSRQQTEERILWMHTERRNQLKYDFLGALVHE